MIDFLKNIGGLGQVMSQLPRIREEMQKLQQRVAALTAEGSAGAGMVHVRVNGKQEVVSCLISEEALQLGDREVLGEMVRGAVNQALERIRQQVAEETSKMASSLGLPPGLSLPGLNLPTG